MTLRVADQGVKLENWRFRGLTTHFRLMKFVVEIPVESAT
jgi:hypothetical protein